MIPKRKIEIVESSAIWAQSFSEISLIIAECLGNSILKIEHVGSTSVPGLAAKPIIDLDVVVSSRQVLPDVIYHLAILGYEHEGDLGIAGREAFRRRGEDVPYCEARKTWMNHHLYVCEAQSRELARHITFRDFLRANPDRALAYGKLKQQLTAQFPHDIDLYIQGKQEFIEESLYQAGWV